MAHPHVHWSQACLILLALSCGYEDDGPPDWATRRIDASQPVQAWTAMEDLRIGELEGEGPEVFGKLLAFDVSPSGVMYLLDAMAQEVRSFDSSGTFRVILGSKGQGPGELLGGGGVSIGPQGWIWVWDVKNDRYTAFDSLGSTMATIPQEPLGIVTPWRGGFGNDGLLYDLAVRFIRLGPLSSYFGKEIEFTPIRIDPDSEECEKLSPFREVLDLTDQGLPRPLGGRLTMARDPTGFFWLAHTSEYVLHKRNMDGDTVLTVIRDSGPVPLDQDEVDSVLAVRWGVERKRLKTGDLPRTGRVLRRVLVGRDGSVFVEPNPLPDDGRTVFDVYSTDGHLVARLDVGLKLEKTPRPKIVGDAVFGVVLGELDEEYFVRLRIQKPDSP